ncbi:MAG: hypothetical protein ABI333_17360 [bacterium]
MEQPTRHSLWALLGLLLLGACPGEPEIPFVFSGEPGRSVPAEFYSDVPLVEVVMNSDAPRQFLVDTGAPATLLDSTVYDREPGVWTPETLECLGITVLDQPCAVYALFGGALTVGGILGGDIFRHFALTVDYREAMVTIHDALNGAPPPGGVEVDEAVSLPFRLLGGGLMPAGEDDLRVAATRVVIELTLEEHVLYAVLDTGASALVLSEELYTTLLDERPDRPVATGFQVLTVEAAHDMELTRVARVALQGDDTQTAAQISVPAMVVHGSGALAALSYETGQTVDVLLGASYLRYYRLTVDYPARRVTLEPYQTPDHVSETEYVTVGFTYEEEAPGDVVIDAVIPDTDADVQGVAIGDRILMAGGFDIVQTGSAAVDTVISQSTEGDRIPFTLVRGQTETDYDLLVEDLLPPFE